MKTGIADADGGLRGSYAEKAVLIFAPDDTCGMDMLTGNLEAMKQVYGKGIRSAEQIKDFLNP